MKAKRLLNRKPSLILLILLAALFTGGGTPLDNTGPDRTVTESHVETYDYGVWPNPIQTTSAGPQRTVRTASSAPGSATPAQAALQGEL
jgi:hypothetical protein